jgi:endonuclease YncB( thermonuclease family)
MRWSRLALPLFVVASVGAGIAALNFAPSPQIKTAEPVAPSKPPATVSAAKATETVPARDVGGGAVPAPVLPDTPLERIAPAPVQKPLEVFGPPMPPLTKDEPFLLFQPVVENAGTLIAEGRTITLAGVVPVEFGRICFNADGGGWPCGKKARTAFRALVRGRAISCLLPDQQKTAVETECRIGKENLGEWLVEQGWAEAAPGSDLENLGKAAKLMGRGIYSRGN